MSEPLYLVKITLDMPELFRFGNLRKLPQRTDDYGYLVHSAMREALGDDAPQPFALQPAEGRCLPVLGYAAHSREELRQTCAQRPDNPAANVVPPDAINAKRMPGTWHPGDLCRFTTTVCPVERKGRNATDRKPGAEVDAYLNSLRNGEETEGSREQVYRRWFQQQVAKTDAAELASFSMEGFRLADLVRRSRDRRARMMRRPQATFSGLLRITDGERFTALLQRGIGRHRAFGFGMLLLKPANH